MILDGRLPALSWPAPQTDYEAQALQFAQNWQLGQTHFTLHTSGSTGTPKPVKLTCAQMLASAQLTGKTFGLQPGDTALCCLNVAYVAGTMMLVRAMTLGLKLTLVEPSGNPLMTFDPATVHFDFLAFVPLQLQTILEQTPDRIAILNQSKAILLGGAATSPALETQLQLIDAPVFATYGMTETVSHIAIRRLNGPEATDYFTALEGVELGTDERQCLNIRAAASNGELIQTNDVVEWVDAEEAHRNFRLLGRVDSVINTGGVKVQPERIERIIQRVLAVAGQGARLFVAGVPDDRLGQRVVLVVEGDETVQASIEAIRPQWTTAIRDQVGPYAVPKDSIFAPKFCETPTGKVDRRKTLSNV